MKYSSLPNILTENQIFEVQFFFFNIFTPRIEDQDQDQGPRCEKRNPTRLPLPTPDPDPLKQTLSQDLFYSDFHTAESLSVSAEKRLNFLFTYYFLFLFCNFLSYLFKYNMNFYYIIL